MGKRGTDTKNITILVSKPEEKRLFEKHRDR